MNNRFSLLPESITGLSDDAWYKLLLESINQKEISGVEFPDFPPPEIQARFVGSSFQQALEEAYYFYCFVKKQLYSLKAPLKPETRFLDFGCGWGRFMRFFWKDIAPQNLYGVDAMPLAIETCRSTGVQGNLDLIEPIGKLPYPDKVFDVIIAYSVFTHLPETLNLHWMQELVRVSKPGCIFCLTLEPRGFIDKISHVPVDTENEWLISLSRFASKAGDLHKKYDRGEMIYLPTGGGDNLTPDVYGDAIVPLAFIRRYWSNFYTIKNYIDYPSSSWRQANLVVQKKAA